MQVFDNIHRLAENVLAAQQNNQQPQQQQQPLQPLQPQQQQQQQQQPQPNQMEDIFEVELYERVRYEMTSARQRNFLGFNRGGHDILNIRFERRVRIVTEDEPDLRGYRAVIYFTPPSD